MLLTWILKELITACIKREAKSKLYTLENRDKDKNNETLCNMPVHARVDPGYLTPNARTKFLVCAGKFLTTFVMRYR